MKTISILNHVLGPVMRGPSSSHTAGAYHIAKMARSLLGEMPNQATLTFDVNGSYAVTYAAQGADRGFAMGLMGKPITEDSFFSSLQDAQQVGLKIEFRVGRLTKADHPNTVEIELTAANGRHLQVVARSIGGGEVEITHLDGHPVLLNGTAYESLVEVAADRAETTLAFLARSAERLEEPVVCHRDGWVRVMNRCQAALPATFRQRLNAVDDGSQVWESAPIYFLQKGTAAFSNAAEMVQLAEQHKVSLGELALEYESQLLGIGQTEVIQEMLRRYDIMVRSVDRGLERDFTGLQLLPSCAGAIFRAEAEGRLATSSLHTRAAARALAVMHVDGAMGVVCAAPTGGSAGVIPGTMVTLAEERSLSREQIALALLAAGSIGAILALRATFAAEVAGCQVEIGASGAMASAAVVDAVGGTARQACDAAAIAFQNTMGTVCDLLHGTVEIPCHTRNGSAAANAFVNADLVLGGYPNLVSLDDTIDAVYAVGQAMPSELRCTSKGGLAITPSALALKPGCGRCG